MNLRKNDTVQVITGRDAGKQGKVLKVLREKNRVIVQGVGFIKKHTRPNPQRNIKGGIAEREAPIHASNVMIVCGECDKRTRIGHKLHGRREEGAHLPPLRGSAGQMSARIKETT